jgi:hypothetical protein
MATKEKARPADSARQGRREVIEPFPAFPDDREP